MDTQCFRPFELVQIVSPNHKHVALQIAPLRHGYAFLSKAYPLQAQTETQNTRKGASLNFQPERPG